MHPNAKSLVTWYRQHRRDLPWRESRDPYRIWLSEVMLQQTRVETVIPYYHRFLDRFPNLESLAEAEEDDVVALWSGLGYYRRARSLHNGAKEVLSRFDGEFPKDLDDALSIPGVGPYTAAAVLSIAYERAHPVVDGNVERVVTRLRRLRGNPKQAKLGRELKRLLSEWIPEGSAGDFNQSLMELGATICTPKSPSCDRCPLSHDCEAYAKGNVESFPEMPPKRPTVSLGLRAAIVRRGEEYLLERPDAFGFLKGLWVFPLVETDDGRKLARELGAKLDAKFVVESSLKEVKHSITYRRITIQPLVLSGDAPSKAPDGFRWAKLSDFRESVAVSSICLKIAKLIESS
ncbi:MAG: A/G-specific adenine glycosylase [Planctomycetota bacterium]